MKKLLAALLCVVIFTLSSAQAAIFPKPTAAPITSVQLNQGITLDGQYIKIKSYKFTNTVKQTIGRKQYTWTADWGKTYLLVTIDWKNVSGSTIYSGLYSSGKKIVYFYADYSTDYHPYADSSNAISLYGSTYYPRNYNKINPSFELIGESLYNGKELEIIYEIQMPEEAAKSNDLKLYIVDDNFNTLAECILRSSKNSKNTSSNTPVKSTSGDTSTVLQYGSSSSKVIDLKKRLQELGYIGKSESTSDYFNSRCKQAVESFQSKNGLPVTGIADQKTLTLLYSSKAKRN